MSERFADSRPPRRSGSPAALRLAAIAAAAAAVVVALPAAAAQEIPLPPPPPGTKRLPLPPPPPGTTLLPHPAAAAEPERCTGCHTKVMQGRVVHGALEKHACDACHRPVTTEAGKCKGRTASKWSLVRTEPELCYGCHARKDQSKSVHTVIRQGDCSSCHTPHSSNFAGRISSPREKICLDCHEIEPLVTKPVKHAPVSEGRCLDCHDAHGGNLPNNVRAESGTAFCMKCHDVKAPKGRGAAGPGYRIDMGKKVVHAAFKRTDCLGCHEGGHGGENLKLLKKGMLDLCYGCHERKDKNRFPHSAVLVGDCAVCHDPHSSDNPKLVARPTTQETCFLCHQDDLTGRKVVHAPVVKGCDQCHSPHGAQARSAVKLGEGKAGCYKCHKPVDGGKVKHAALERYGCTGCHDPHGTANGALLPQKVNALCVSCHEGQQDGRHVTPILRGGHVLGGGTLADPRREGRSFSCASCHDPHGSNNPKLFYYGAAAMDSCAWCHGDKSGKAPELKNVISRARKPASSPGLGGGAGGAGGSGGGGAGSGAGSGSGEPPPAQAVP